MVTVDLALLGLASGSLIPLVTGLLTKVSAPAALKAFVSLVLAGVTAVVSLLTEYGGTSTVKEALYVFFVAVIAHAGAYYGFLKPSGIAPAIHQGTGTVGIG